MPDDSKVARWTERWVSLRVARAALGLRGVDFSKPACCNKQHRNRTKHPFLLLLHHQNPTILSTTSFTPRITSSHCSAVCTHTNFTPLLLRYCFVLQSLQMFSSSSTTTLTTAHTLARHLVPPYSISFTGDGLPLHARIQFDFV